MPGITHVAESQNIQSIFNRGPEASACANGRPAFINKLTEASNDPIASFKQHPHQTMKATELFYHEAQENLPADFLYKPLSANGEKIRTLIGIIYSDVKKSGNGEDIATLEKICNNLVAAQGKESKEKKVEKELVGLVSKYSTAACNDLIDRYIGHCMAAWEADHQARSVDTQGKAIFKHDLDTCKSTLEKVVADLAKPDQSWETMVQNLNFLTYDCAAISKTLTCHEAQSPTPVSDDPDGSTPGPENRTDNQRLYIPTGPGEKGIHLEIRGGNASIGDISHTCGATAAGPADPNAAIVKHILDSGLTNIEKVDLIKDLFKSNIDARESHFLNKLASVQGGKPQQSSVTQETVVANRERETQTSYPGSQSIALQTESDMALYHSPASEESDDNSSTGTPQQQSAEWDRDSLDGVELRENRTSSNRSSFSDYTPVYTTSRTFDPFNRRSSMTSPFLQTAAESAPNRNEGKIVMRDGQSESPGQRAPSPVDQLDKKGFANVQNVTLKQTAEPDASDSITDAIMTANLESVANPQADSKSWRDRAFESRQKAASTSDTLDEMVQRNSSEQPARKSALDGFQPARVPPAPSLPPKATGKIGDKAVDNRIYTTVRTVDPMKREPRPVKPLSTISMSELQSKFKGLEERNRNSLEKLEKNIENKNTESQEDPEIISFQEKLALFKRAAAKQP